MTTGGPGPGPGHRACPGGAAGSASPAAGSEPGAAAAGSAGARRVLPPSAPAGARAAAAGQGRGRAVPPRRGRAVPGRAGPCRAAPPRVSGRPPGEWRSGGRGGRPAAPGHGPRRGPAAAPGEGGTYRSKAWESVGEPPATGAGFLRVSPRTPVTGLELGLHGGSVPVWLRPRAAAGSLYVYTGYRHTRVVLHPPRS